VRRQRSRRVLTPEFEQKILATTLKTRARPDATHWSVRGLARHLRVSRMMVHRVWQIMTFNFISWTVDKFKISNDQLQHLQERRRPPLATAQEASPIPRSFQSHQ